MAVDRNVRVHFRTVDTLHMLNFLKSFIHKLSFVNSGHWVFFFKPGFDILGDLISLFLELVAPVIKEWIAITFCHRNN